MEKFVAATLEGINSILKLSTKFQQKKKKLKFFWQRNELQYQIKRNRIELEKV